MTRNRPLPVPLEEIPFVPQLARLAPPLDWAALFGRRAPIEVEIGSGKGLFLAEAARQHPEVDYIGVECAGKWLRRAVYRLLREGLPNVRIVEADAFDFLQRWVPPASVRVVHVYFPDPWPKARHARRRLLQDRLYDFAARGLVPGGEFRLASDVQGYFEEAVRALAARPGFGRLPWEENAEGLPTNFAVKYRREGRALYAARFAVEPVQPTGETGEAASRVVGSPAGGER